MWEWVALHFRCIDKMTNNPFSVSVEGTLKKAKMCETLLSLLNLKETHLCQCPETEAMWVQFKTVSKGMTFHVYSN